jgi:three-Cys-motif partner protein
MPDDSRPSAAPLPLFGPELLGPLDLAGRPKPRRVAHRDGAAARSSLTGSNGREHANASDFFDRLREWSRWKHYIEEGYLPQFAKILGREGRRVNWVDAFAGGGRYGDDAPGSPLIAAAIAQDLAQHERGPFRLRCINYELNGDLHRELCEATAGFDARAVINRNEAFGPEASRRVVAEIADEPALFFLDPFGVEGLEWETLRVIGERSPAHTTEMILNFNVPKLDRHAGWVDSHHQPAQRAFLDLVRRVWPEDDDSWLQIVTRIPDPERRRDRLCRAYMNEIKRRFGFHVVRFPVRTQDTGQLKYYLVHATRNATALLLISQIYYSAHRRYQEAVRAFRAERDRDLGRLPLPIPWEQYDAEHEDKIVALLERDVVALGRQARHISIFELQLRLMDHYFGRVARKHFDRVCAHLVECGVINRPKGPRGIGWMETLRFVA